MYARTIVVFFTVLLTACATTTRGRSVVLRGQVLDPANAPVAGAMVTAGSRAARTDALGEFRLVVPRAERIAATIIAPRFIETTRVFTSENLARGKNVIVIWPRAAAVPLDASLGGTLTFPGGTIAIPPAALVDANGQPATGNVRVSLSAIDVSDPRQLRSAPGDFTARMRDGSTQRLETFGIFEVFAEDAAGRRLDLARGREAQVRLRIPPPLQRNAPDVVGSFRFDPADGRWVEEGRMILAPAGDAFDFPIPTFAVKWNADQVMATTCIKLQVLDSGCGQAAATVNAHVEAGGVNYTGYSHDYTDGSGEACLSVKKSAVAGVTVNGGNALNIATPATIASAPGDCNNPALCPLVATTHLGGAGFVEPLNADDPSRWTKADWQNADQLFGTAWKPTTNHVSFANGELTLTLTDYGNTPADVCATDPVANCHGENYTSGEYRTNCFYGYGTYKAKIRAARGDGLVTTFFTYTDIFDGTAGPNNTNWHDEIDIEILGKTPASSGCAGTIVQFNYFIKGTQDPEPKCLLFDASLMEHEYEFRWTQTEIKWYVDGVHQHTEFRPSPTADWPSQPGRVMASVWAGDNTNGGAVAWLGTFNYNAAGIIRDAVFSEISYTP